MEIGGLASIKALFFHYSICKTTSQPKCTIYIHYVHLFEFIYMHTTVRLQDTGSTFQFSNRVTERWCKCFDTYRINHFLLNWFLHILNLLSLISFHNHHLKDSTNNLQTLSYNTQQEIIQTVRQPYWRSRVYTCARCVSPSCSWCTPTGLDQETDSVAQGSKLYDLWQI